MHKFNSLKNAAFFCSEHTFSGFTIPHSKIDAPYEPREHYASDPALREKFSSDYYSSENSLCSKLSIADNNAPLTLHENQFNGFERWKNRRKQPAPAGMWNTDKTLLELIRKKYANNDQFPGKYSVSSSSLAPYFQCSLKWLFSRVLNPENAQIEASLMAENISGMVYHAALNLFFAEIKKTKEALLQPFYEEKGISLPPGYQKLLKHSVDTIFDNFPALQSDGRPQMSSLTARLLRAGKRHFQFHLENCLAHFLSFFAGYHVAGCEISYQAERGQYFLNGKLDCILEDISDAENKYVIVDFKLKHMPRRDDCTGEGENGLSDFQLPMYITLAEENNRIKVNTALFYSILNYAPEVIIGTVNDVNKNIIIPKKEDDRILPASERYNIILEEFIQKAGQFADEISTGNLSIFESRYNECNNCNYNRICRTVYIINREKNITLGKH
jgi:hypothetical protein